MKSLIEFDSIWRLLSGQESDAYMEDPQYAAIFKLNTIAHYDPVILEILDASYGSAFFKDAESHFLVDEAWAICWCEKKACIFLMQALGINPHPRR